MNPERPFSQELWEETPAAVQDDIRTIEARVAALETVVQRLEATVERAIRPGVWWRTGRFGTQRADGSRFVDAMMTRVAPLKPPHRQVLDDLTVACRAARCGEPASSLRPTPDHRQPRMRLAA